MPAKTQSFLSVASYNVLCDAYIKPEYYPRCDPADFRPERRHPLLLQRVAGLDTDVICLQEVDEAMFDRLSRKLGPLGYRGRWLKKASDKTDGCATFVRGTSRIITRFQRTFQDGGGERPDSGYVALETVLVTPEGHGVTVVNTHLKWESSDVPANARYGLAQARELARVHQSNLPVVICADFNADHDSETMQTFALAGFHNAHLAEMAPTCFLDGELKKFDAVLCNDGFLVHDWSTTPIDASTRLPSSVEPSDHVPIVATLVTERF